MDGKSIRNKLIGNEEQRAVSPVIGVILMVAITVILAAVIAAFVLDLGGQVGSEAQAGVSVDGDGTSEVTITVDSLGNADGVYVAGTDSDDPYLNSDFSDNSSIEDAGTLENVGQSSTITGTGSGTYNVVAYLGNSPSDAETETNVQDFELDS